MHHLQAYKIDQPTVLEIPVSADLDTPNIFWHLYPALVVQVLDEQQRQTVFQKKCRLTLDKILYACLVPRESTPDMLGRKGLQPAHLTVFSLADSDDAPVNDCANWHRQDQEQLALMHAARSGSN